MSFEEKRYLGMDASTSRSWKWYSCATVTPSPTLPTSSVSGRNGTTSGIREIRIREFSTEEDAIQGISADEDADDNIYDISGRKVSRPVKGIYIRGGKKIAVK